MKNKDTLLNVLIISLFLSIAVFGYLTYHHYSIRIDASTPSLCKISATLNCDAAATSSYAEIASVPIALVGLCFSIFMAGFFILAKINFLEVGNFSKSLMLTLFIASAVFSLYLAFITFTQLKAICPFCIAGYVLSFLQLGLVIALVKGPEFSFSLMGFSENMGLIGSLLIIPFVSFVVAKNLNTNYNLDEIKLMITEKTAIWQRATANTFDNTLGLIHGTPSGKATIVEFADFKCPHCKHAATTLKKFKESTPDAAIIFKPFPLDGQCNPNIEFKGDKSRCTMAGWVLCSEKFAKKGWLVHDWLFEKQESLIPLYGDELDKVFKTFSSENNLNYDEISMCASSSDTAVLISKMSEEAKGANVQGTPTIFLNNKKLEAAQVFDVLKNAYSTLL